MSSYVWVPQEDGEIILTQDSVSRRFIVDGHIVTAQNAYERDRLVEFIADARDATSGEKAAKTRRSSRTTPASPDEPPAVEAGGEDTDEPDPPAPTTQE